MGLPYTLANGVGNLPDATQVMANFNMALLKDGSVVPTANLPIGGFKLTGLAAGTTNGDSLRYEQLLGLYLLLTGGTMSGAIAMGSNKITGLAAGTTSGDALRFEQLNNLYLLLTGGTLTNNLAFSPTTKGIVGTNTNDSASAGNVGEIIQSQITSGSPTSLVSSTAKNVTSIPVTAGDWDIYGVVGYIPGGTVSWFQQSSGTTSAVCDNEQTTSLTAFASAITPSVAAYRFPIATARFSFSTPTTVYLIAQAVFGTSMSAFGTITARRSAH